MTSPLTRPEKAVLRRKTGDEESLSFETIDFDALHSAEASASSASRVTIETPLSHGDNVSETSSSQVPTNCDQPGGAAYPWMNAQVVGILQSILQEPQVVQGTRVPSGGRVLSGHSSARQTGEDESEHIPKACIFLCTGTGKDNEKALMVPVYREGCKEEEIPYFLSRLRYSPPDTKGEKDAEIYKRLRLYWNDNFRTWRQYIPFYGIADVREIEFEFEPRVHDGGNAFKVRVTKPNTSEIRKKAADDINAAIKSANEHTQLGYDCALSEDLHTASCIASETHIMDYVCPAELGLKAEERLRTLEYGYYVKICFNDPSKANALDTLNGIIQETCVYNRRSLKGVIPERGLKPEYKPKLRGIYVEVGWDIDLMRARLPLIVFVLFSLVLFLRMVSGDWNLALQAGQFLATLVALGVPIAMHMVQER